MLLLVFSSLWKHKKCVRPLAITPHININRIVFLYSQVKGYRGEVFCPDRRLCLYPDVSPPIDRNSSSGFTTWQVWLQPETGPLYSMMLPPLNEYFWFLFNSDPEGTIISPQDVTWSPLRSTSQVMWLCSGAAGCVLVALLVSYWKRRTCMIRSSSVAPEDHSHL